MKLNCHVFRKDVINFVNVSFLFYVEKRYVPKMTFVLGSHLEQGILELQTGI